MAFAAFLSALAVPEPDLALGILLIAAAALFVVTARPGLIVLVTTAVTVIHPSVWPQLGTFSEYVVHFGDVCLLVVCATVLLRYARLHRTPVLLLLALLVLFGVTRNALSNGSESTASFFRVMEPVIVWAVVGRSLPRDFGLWRWARWSLLGVLATVPLFGDTAYRWSGLPGGPNEVALIAAVLVVLGAAESSPAARTLFLVSGVIGLFGARGIGASAGALAGLAVLAIGRREQLRAMRTTRGIRLLVLVGAAVSAFLFIPRIRPDLHITLWVHTSQAESFWGAFGAANPLVGSGWSQMDSDALMDTYRITHIAGLHNVYLDIAVYLGMVGSVLFLMLLWHIWRPGDLVTRAVLCATAVWFNTTGAYPCAGWGMLGLAVAAASCRVTPRSGPEAPTDRTSPRTYGEVLPAPAGSGTAAVSAPAQGTALTKTLSTRNQQAVLSASRHSEPHANAAAVRSGPGQN
ncbi:hypothetical protein [Streptomyces cavernae]|uniref:hypothetical protein n=1 Tax=Streptomyces cavernae TaxID=2259034 RepID=UPI000FEBAE43|nr:hypothetical protein [Streptomyces cavernae]